MRIAIGLLGATLMLAGCAFHKQKPTPQPPSAPVSQQPKPVVTPDFRAVGHVAMVNAEARFVVISFPNGPVPQADGHLNVYRNGQKVGELKVTGPQRESDTVADIVSGEVQLHDEVRTE